MCLRTITLPDLKMWNWKNSQHVKEAFVWTEYKRRRAERNQKISHNIFCLWSTVFWGQTFCLLLTKHIASLPILTIRCFQSYITYSTVQLLLRKCLLWWKNRGDQDIVVDTEYAREACLHSNLQQSDLSFSMYTTEKKEIQGYYLSLIRFIIFIFKCTSNARSPISMRKKSTFEMSPQC